MKFGLMVVDSDRLEDYTIFDYLMLDMLASLRLLPSDLYLLLPRVNSNYALVFARNNNIKYRYVERSLHSYNDLLFTVEDVISTCPAHALLCVGEENFYTSTLLRIAHVNNLTTYIVSLDGEVTRSEIHTDILDIPYQLMEG